MHYSFFRKRNNTRKNFEITEVARELSSGDNSCYIQNCSKYYGNTAACCTCIECVLGYECSECPPNYIWNQDAKYCLPLGRMQSGFDEQKACYK